MALHCEKGLLPISCRRMVIEQCVYCGKHFCLKHGHLDKAVCKSPTCLRKYKKDRAIADRTAWEEEQHQIGFNKNGVGLCGQPNCRNSLYVVCSHCEVSYCPEHVSRFTFSFRTHTRRNVTRVKGDITLCEICKPRLVEYRRDRFE